KISDVHLDIEKRMAEVKTRKEKVKTLRAQFVSWERLYQSASVAFKGIQEASPGEKEFLLQSDDKTIEQLKNIQGIYDSCTLMFNSYKTTLASMGKTSYNQNFNARKIENFKADGQGLPDFYSDELKVWNFGDWCARELHEIQNEVQPFREKLVAYDVE